MIYPNNNTADLPVIFYAHGGAYISGDKEENQNYMVRLANEGYVVVNINYALAPNYIFPTPLTQMKKVWDFIHFTETTLEEKYEIKMDMDNIFLGGDSAGANLVTLFTAYNLEPKYFANAPHFSKHDDDIIVDNFKSNGLFLFCGVFDFNYFGEMSGIIGFATTRIARGITGFWDWEASGVATEMSLYTKNQNEGFNSMISNSFPPCYITDGSETVSLNKQGETVVALLSELEIDVKSRFFPDLIHEFQFMMGNVPNDDKLSESERAKIDACITAANLVFADVIEFLDSNS